MEFLAGAFFGYIVSWPSLVILVLLSSILVHGENYVSATLAGILGAVTAYFLFNVTLESIGYTVAGYFAAGFIWSIWRYRRWVRAQVAEYSERDLSDSYRAKYQDDELAKLAPNYQLGRLTAWVILWPFSMLGNVTGDIVHLVQTVITRFFKGIYTKIFESALQDLAPPKPAEKAKPTSGDYPGPN